MTVPVRLVYSFALADNVFREQLSTHLRPLVQQRVLIEWYEQRMLPGSDVDQERHHAWQSANILLLLLSADYLASDIFESQDMQQALERHRSGQLRIVPLLLRPCDWQGTFVVDLQRLPRNGEPVTKWNDRDEALLSVVQELRRMLPEQGSASTLTSEERTNRAYLLKQVRGTWIDGLLKPSLQHAVWVDLHLQSQSDAVENPWRLMVQELDREPHPLPPGTSILQVLDEADEELLILGDPGAGKTTLLLYLAQTLLDHAESEIRRRIPVVFHLASWAQQRLPLAQWLQEELSIRYRIPRKVGQAWLNANQIFPLLDGLDEVVESVRTACVQAIKAFAQQSTERTPLVICCRTEEYQSLSAQLPLRYAVMLLPFSDDQIEVYLSSVSGHLDALREVFHEDKDLFELARRPLMLSVFTQAYHDKVSIDLLAMATREEYPRALFHQYVKQMLKRRALWEQRTEEQIFRWLTFFATQLYQQQQTLFAVEELQPSWLPGRYQAWYRWSMALMYGLTFGLLGGPLFCLAFGLIYELLGQTTERLVFGTAFGLILGLSGGLTGGLVFGLVFRHHRKIQPAEITVWSWAAASKGLLVGVLAGLVFCLIGGLVGWVVAGAAGGIVVGCVVEGIIGSVGGIVGGLSPTQIPERVALAPNEGIWRSGKRGLIAILLFILLIGLTIGLVVGLLGTSINNPVAGIPFGLIFGVVGGLIFGVAFNLTSGRTGIAAFLQHFVLRFFLWRLGLLPWNLVAFLDEATARLILRKVGGSYIFIHRLLRDVLATQDPQA